MKDDTTARRDRSLRTGFQPYERSIISADKSAVAAEVVVYKKPVSPVSDFGMLLTDSRIVDHQIIPTEPRFEHTADSNDSAINWKYFRYGSDSREGRADRDRGSTNRSDPETDTCERQRNDSSAADPSVRNRPRCGSCWHLNSQPNRNQL